MVNYTVFVDFEFEDHPPDQDEWLEKYVLPVKEALSKSDLTGWKVN